MSAVRFIRAISVLVICSVGFSLPGGQPATPPIRSEIQEHLAKRIIGRVVENQDAIVLGKVQDFVVEMNTGHLRYAVVSSGGFAGLKARLKHVPGPALSLATAKRGVLFLEVPSKKWSQAPRFRKSDLPKLADLVSIRQVYGFYGVSIGEAPAENSPKSGAGQLSGTGRETPEGVAKPGGLRLASDLVGRGVVNGRQEKLGTVTDFLLDFSGKKPLMVIITAKGLLKPSEYFAVPLRTLRPNGEGGFLLDATRIMLQRAVLLDDRSWRESPSENAVYRHCAR